VKSSKVQEEIGHQPKQYKPKKPSKGAAKWREKQRAQMKKLRQEIGL
jgi:hypothetical protein